MPLLGHLDRISRSNVISGWAFDSELCPQPLSISIFREDGTRLGSGLANLFRQDLSDQAFGMGWCAFELRCEPSIPHRKGPSLLLVANATHEVIGSAKRLPLVDDAPALSSIEDAIACDPFALKSIDQLMGCDPLFNRFVARKGFSAFVRTAYLYVLGRPVDSSGLSHYSRLLKRSSISPFGLIQALADSDEFRSRQRAMSAPPAPDFPFWSDPRVR